MAKREQTDKDREYARNRYANRSEEDNQRRLLRNKEHYERNKGKILIRCRKHHLQKTYGLSAEDYFQKLLFQKNRCAICGKEEHRITKTGDVKPLSVDHNHTTGEVRELLCNDCNALLGFSNENIEVLKNAIDYIKKHQ
mgnify:CR=1 FL=1